MVKTFLIALAATALAVSGAEIREDGLYQPLPHRPLVQLPMEEPIQLPREPEPMTYVIKPGNVAFGENDEGSNDADVDPSLCAAWEASCRAEAALEFDNDPEIVCEANFPGALNAEDTRVRCEIDEVDYTYFLIDDARDRFAYSIDPSGSTEFVKHLAKRTDWVALGRRTILAEWSSKSRTEEDCKATCLSTAQCVAYNYKRVTDAALLAQPMHAHYCGTYSEVGPITDDVEQHREITLAIRRGN